VAPVVEDERTIAANLIEYLEARSPHGYCLMVRRQSHALASETYDVIVLDLGLPRTDGLRVCAASAQNAGGFHACAGATARDTLSSKLESFQAGADDYLTAVRAG
jgi:DNA-binding response OmpR family regulator